MGLCGGYGGTAGTVRHDSQGGVLGSFPSVGSTKAQQTAAFLYRPTFANDATLPTLADVRPQMASFLAPSPKSRRADIDGSGFEALAFCLCAPTISGRRGRRVVRRRGSAEGEPLVAPAPFVDGRQALAERRLELPVRACRGLEQGLEVARPPFDVRARLMGCLSPRGQSSACRRVRTGRLRRGAGVKMRRRVSTPTAS